MITIFKILWFLWTVGAKLATIGLACFVLEQMFNALEATLDKYQKAAVVTV